MVIRKGGDRLSDDFPIPKREGYTFDGWYTSDTAAKQVYTTTNFKNSTEVFARWNCETAEYNYTLGNKTAVITRYNGNSENVVIPEKLDGKKLTAINWLSFAANKGIKSVVIPEGVTKIDKMAFYDCGNLASVTLPNSLRSIGELAFAGCSSLKNITIPSGVKTISAFAFANCDSLTISGYNGSAAKNYAESNGVQFIALN